jgi:hypothetical protein
MRDAGSEVQDARSGMSYRDLEIWKLAREKAIAFMDGVKRLHRMNRSDIAEPASRITHLAS